MEFNPKSPCPAFKNRPASQAILVNAGTRFNDEIGKKKKKGFTAQLFPPLFLLGIIQLKDGGSAVKG